MAAANVAMNFLDYDAYGNVEAALRALRRRLRDSDATRISVAFDYVCSAYSELRRLVHEPRFSQRPAKNRDALRYEDINASQLLSTLCRKFPQLRKGVASRMVDSCIYWNYLR
jgi:hypothetical protein